MAMMPPFLRLRIYYYLCEKFYQHNLQMTASTYRLNVKNNQRLSWVDNAKGFAIILVVLGHICLTETVYYFNAWICSFHMPLFFALSGLFTVKHINEETWFLHFKKRFKRIMIPYLVYGIFIQLFFWIYYKYKFPEFDRLFLQAIISQLLNYQISDMGQAWSAHLWFLPCLFLADLMVWTTWKFIRNQVGRCSVMILLLSVGIIYYLFINRSLPLRLQTALIAIVFIIAGLLINNNRRMKWIWVVCLLSIYVIFWGLNGFSTMIMSISEYDNVFYFIISAFCGIIAIIEIMKRVTSVSILSKIGKQSLAIYIFQSIFTPFLFAICKKAPYFDNIIIQIPLLCVAAFGCCVCCMYIGQFLEHYFPWSFGMSRKHATFEKNK